LEVAHIDFFYFFGSGYAYLSVLRIERLAAEAGVEVRWRPINVRPLMAKNNVALRSEALKVRYLWRDIERRAAHHRLPFVKPPIWTTDPTLLANRVGIVAAQGGWCKEYTIASFRAWYLDGLPLGTKESLAHILGPLGQDVDATIAMADTPEIVARYEAETEVALGHGVFGSPSFVVDGEMFWGDDRLEEAIQWAQGKHALQIAHDK
jgi:2-hydroxychromene-2-carboxylate isomerase